MTFVLGSAATGGPLACLACSLILCALRSGFGLFARLPLDDVLFMTAFYVFILEPKGFRPDGLLRHVTSPDVQS